MPAPFQNRGEEMFRRSEFYIDDNLDSVIRKKDCYSLYFKGEDDNFERHAYYRISGKLLKPGELTVTLPVVKKQGLTVSGNGDFGVEIELFYRKPGRAADDIYDKPDSVLYMPVPEGTGKYRRCLRHSHCRKMWLVLSCVSAGRISTANVGWKLRA